MQLDYYLSFITYACATTFLPGPNNVLLFTQAGRYGILRIRPLLLGIWSGLVTVMLLAGFFCHLLGNFIPKIFSWFRFAGAAYILYLAFKTFRRGPVKTPDPEEKGPEAAQQKEPQHEAARQEAVQDRAARGMTAQQPEEDRPLGYLNGFLLQFLNVKVIMLGLAAYPGYFLPMGNSAGLVVLFAVTMTVCCGMGNLIWTFLGHILTPIYNRYYKAVNTLMALLLVWCAWRVVS